jgi:hypothetical protein
LLLPLRSKPRVRPIPNTFGYLCLHLHLYQPPRANAFTGLIPREPTGDHYHDFNEKIFAECYRKLAKAHIFRSVSFNVGPTLAQWLEEHHPDIWHRIRRDEQWHRKRYQFSNALAQPYNHTILPLTRDDGGNRDIATQIEWGIAAYEHFFGHRPAGMWLPEMAVDQRTLDIMAQKGISYTVLSGSQLDVHCDIDRTKPARLELKTGRRITVFFRDDFVNGMLTDGQKGITRGYGASERFVRERLPHYHEKFAPLTLLAMDAETFGHHLPDGDKFVSHLLTTAAPQEGFGVTSLEAYLNLYGVSQTATIRQRTSWSCSHRLERWEHGCDCERSGGYQPWKEILRHALNNLSRKAYELYESEVREVLPVPHAARNGYIGLHDGWLSERAFWQTHGKHHKKPSSGKLVHKIRLLLEAHYFLQQAYTSCAWYWESYTSGEVQIVLDAARRAMHLIFQATGIELQEAFVRDLQKVGGYPQGYPYQPLTEITPCEFENRIRHLRM